MHQVAQAYHYITSGILSLNQEIEFLNALEVEYILNMEMEKHRKKLQKLD